MDNEFLPQTLMLASTLVFLAPENSEHIFKKYKNDFSGFPCLREKKKTYMRSRNKTYKKCTGKGTKEENEKKIR